MWIPVVSYSIIWRIRCAQTPHLMEKKPLLFNGSNKKQWSMLYYIARPQTKPGPERDCWNWNSNLMPQHHRGYLNNAGINAIAYLDIRIRFITLSFLVNPACLCYPASTYIIIIVGTTGKLIPTEQSYMCCVHHLNVYPGPTQSNIEPTTYLPILKALILTSLIAHRNTTFRIIQRKVIIKN